MVLVVANATLGFSCARNAEERQLDTMRDEIQELQQVQDREAARGTDDNAAPKAPPPSPEAPPPNALSSSAVTLGAGEQAAPTPDENADTEDTVPRPSIRVMGPTRSSGRGASRGEDAVERSDPDQPANSRNDTDRAASLAPEAARAYEAALAQVRAKQLDKALDAFAAFLVRWPDHPYADAAMYWRGDCYYSRGDYAHAIEQLEGVLARYPEGAKVPDALLKLGMAEQKLGHADKSRTWFEQLVQRFPESAPAHRVPPSRTPDVRSPDTTR
jgi:tol-pal system protein YbgF